MKWIVPHNIWLKFAIFSATTWYVWCTANEQCCNFADGATTWKRAKSCENFLVLVSSGVWIGDWLIAGSHCPRMIAMSSTNSFKERKRWCTWRWSSSSIGDLFVHQKLFYRPCFIRRIIWISWTSPVFITMLLVGMERCFSLGSVDGTWSRLRI